MMDGTDRAEKQSKLLSALKHDRRSAMLHQMLYGAVGCALLANEFRFRPACNGHRASQRATLICAITLLRTNAALFSSIGSDRFSATADCQSAGAQTRFPILELGGSEEITSTETLSADGKSPAYFQSMLEKRGGTQVYCRTRSVMQSRQLSFAF
jgi:hypothetical protein